MTTKQIYIAKNGKRFDDYLKCLEYEKEIEKDFERYLTLITNIDFYDRNLKKIYIDNVYVITDIIENSDDYICYINIKNEEVIPLLKNDIFKKIGIYYKNHYNWFFVDDIISQRNRILEGE